MQLNLFNIDTNLKDKFEQSLIDKASLKDFHYNFKNGNYTNFYMKDAFEDFKNGKKNRFVY